MRRFLGFSNKNRQDAGSRESFDRNVAAMIS